MERIVYVVGHRNPDLDSIASAIAYAHLKHRLGEPNVRAARAGDLDAETAFALDRFGVPPPPLLTDATGHDLILVDHNEIGQALPHIEEANVLEVWEHHRIGDLRLAAPILFHCEPVGATATLIGELYFLHHVTPPSSIAAVLLAAILSDTVGFRSPTTSEKDRMIAGRLAQLAGLDVATFGAELLRIKAATVERRSAAEIVRTDYKEFLMGGQRVGIGQVETLNPGALAEKRADILREMRALREADSLTQIILMVTDVQSKASDLWFVGGRSDLFERAFGRLDGGVVHLPGVMSRKKQVVPRLDAAFSHATGALATPVHG